MRRRACSAPRLLSAAGAREAERVFASLARAGERRGGRPRMRPHASSPPRPPCSEVMPATARCPRRRARWRSA
eukprot:scaffold2003_cov420-Prasinococcus_capsulatus_cf.AAC.6